MRVFDISNSNYLLIKNKARGERATLYISDIKNSPRKNQLCYLRFKDYFFLVSVARRARAGLNYLLAVDVLEKSIMAPLF